MLVSILIIQILIVTNKRSTHTLSGLGSWFPKIGYTGVSGKSAFRRSVIFVMISVFPAILVAQTAWSTKSPVT